MPSAKKSTSKSPKSKASPSSEAARESELPKPKAAAKRPGKYSDRKRTELEVSTKIVAAKKARDKKAKAEAEAEEEARLEVSRELVIMDDLDNEDLSTPVTVGRQALEKPVEPTGVAAYEYPIDLEPECKRYWEELVNCKPHDYFDTGDVPLMKMYARCAYEVDLLTQSLRRDGHIIANKRGTPIMNPAVVARAYAEQRLLSLSSKLRVQPASRYASDDDRSRNAKKGHAMKAAEEIEKQESGQIPPGQNGGDDSDDDGPLLAGSSRRTLQ